MPQSVPSESNLGGEVPEGARARLQAAALEAFAGRGFHGTSTRDIASAAGMSPAAVYVHYRSKEELLFEISLAGHQETLRLARGSVTHGHDPAARLFALVRTFVHDHATNHTRARVVNYELAALAPDHFRQISLLRRDIDAVMRSVVEDGLRTGEFRVPDPSMTSLTLLSMGIDVARWFRDDALWTPDEIAEHHALMALRMVGASLH